LRWRYSQNRLHRVFAAMVAGAAAYSVFLAGLAAATTEAEASAWVRLAEPLSFSVLFGFFWFSMVFSRAEGRPWVRRVLWGSAALVALNVLGRLSGLAPTRLVQVPGQGWFPGPDPLFYGIYVPVMAVLILSSLTALWRRHRASGSSLERRQIAYVFLAIGGATLLSLFNRWPQTAILAAFSPVVFTGILGYGITRQQLLELRLLLRQGALGALLSAVLAFLLALALLLSRHVWSGSSDRLDLLGLVGAAALFTLLYEPLRRISARLLDRLFDIGNLDTGARLLAYAQMSGQHPRIDDYLTNVCQRLQEEHDLSNALILLPDRQGDFSPFVAAPREAVGVGEALPASSPALRRLQGEPQGLDVDELSWIRRYEEPGADDPDDGEAALAAYLKACQAQAAFALKAGDGRVLGILMVGQPRNGRGLRQVERGFFAALAPQMAVVLDNALLQGQIRHADRLHSLGTLAAGLAHELRNPLSSILVFVQLLPEKFHDEAFREKFNRIVQQELDKLNRLTEQLLQISRPSTQALGALDLEAQVARVEQLLRYQYRRKGVRLDLQCPSGLWVRGSADELGQVLLNLLLNALDASPAQSTVTLRAWDDGKNSAYVQVTDQGPGIAPQNLARLFEPFFTTKAGGNGLGLATSLRIIESFGGSLRAVPGPGGACFEIRLPRLAAPGGDEARVPSQRREGA
jgi:signal transduction histidine kinase